MSKISQELHAGEKISKEFSMHPLDSFSTYVIGGILILIVIGIPLIIVSELMRRGHKYYLTNERIIHQYVFLSKKTSTVFYDKVQDVRLTQGLIERIFGLGKIHVNTAGTHTTEIVFKGVKNPAEIKRIIERHVMEKKRMVVQGRPV